MILTLFMRELSLGLRARSGAWATLAFFFLLLALFAFTLTPEILNKSLLGVVTTALLLSSQLAVPQLFERDFNDGTLEQFWTLPIAPEWIVAAKLLAFWVMQLLPIVLLSPVVFYGLGIVVEWQSVVLQLGLFSWVVLSLHGLSAAFTIGSRAGALMQILIMLPFYIPAVVFVTSTGTIGAWVLGIMALIMVPATSWIAAQLLRQAID